MRFVFGIIFLVNSTCLFSQLTYPNILIEFDSAWTHKNLQLIPIRFKQTFFDNQSSNFPRLISLQQAMKEGKVHIKEWYYNGDADVRTLQISNKSNDHIVLQQGDMLKGGKQDRMIAESKILAPKQQDEFLSVYCIERGRWDKKATTFSYAGSADAWLKKTMDSTNQQQYIWKEIEHRLPNNDAVITTWPYLQVFNDTTKIDTSYTNFFQQKMKVSDSLFAGYIAVTDSSIISCEVFASTTLTVQFFDKLIKSWSYAAIIKGNKPVVTYKQLNKFANLVFSSEEQQKNYVQKHGKQYIYQHKTFHLVAY